MAHNLDRVHVIESAGSPYVRIQLFDDDGENVDLSSGYSGFTAKVARRSNPDNAVLTIAGVTGTSEGFLVPAATLVELPTTPVYILTAAATEAATGEVRAAQAEVVIDPSPL